MIKARESIFGTMHNDLHRLRRSALNPFFSTAAVLRFHNKIQEVVDRMTNHMKRNIEKDEPIPIFFALRSVSVDIICEYIFGKELYLTERADWGQSFYASWRSLWDMMALLRQLKFLTPLMQSVPKSLLAMIDPKALEAMEVETRAKQWTKELLESDPEVMKEKPKTVLWELAHSDALPPGEKSIMRLAMEGNILLGAGFETTGSTLSHIIYGVLSNPGIHSKLQEELDTAIPDPDNIPSYQVLEKLPYLHAVIKEGMR